ncbi:hypothetical protein QFC22_001196 [Naganishia vaughanmartiniae]|uniref:Uncharacterized protein n=1 Tax=Naganishia vaughanmartiniae TaxID=1424756 RepID=A0ACC2XLZ3_9TREE|nr:hypothetical protein QFC22_001196 [Naganishia vaughanmartiniae]
MLSIKNTVVLTLAVSAGAYAQDISDSASSSASASLTASASTASASAVTASNISTAMIPGNISTSCASYLHSLNTDAKFSSCVQPLTNVTALFNPTQGNNNPTAYATSDITKTLANLCSSSSGCSNTLVRSYLSQFYSACKPELQANDNGNAAVRDMYDFLYVVNPFRNAICTKNGATSRYCVLEIGSSGVASEAGSTNATTSASGNGASIADQVASANASANANVTNSTTAGLFKSLATTYGTTAQEMFAPVAAAAANLVIYTPLNAVNAMAKRMVAPRAEGDDSTTTSSESTIMTPNTTTFRTTSLSYLFLQPNMSASILCTTCTKNVMASYVAWEAQTPYALGLGASPILGAQQALWESLGETCGANFTQQITAAAGVLTTNSTNAVTTSGAATDRTVAMGGLSVVVGAVVAALSLF